jgi:hypothetical protein
MNLHIRFRKIRMELYTHAQANEINETVCQSVSQSVSQYKLTHQ